MACFRSCAKGGGLPSRPLTPFSTQSSSRANTELRSKAEKVFRSRRAHLGSALKVRRLDITQVNDTFDVTLFLGVLYHQRHPLQSLEQLSKLTNECAVIETHYLKGQDQPVMRFYPGDSLNSDTTNYWGPSLSCAELMLLDVGFRDVRVVATSEGNDDRVVILGV